MCVPDVIKSMNVKVFNLIPKTKETRHTKWDEIFLCKCRLAASVFNNKQRCHEDKCRCECKELFDKVVCDQGFLWSPSNCEWKRDKSWDVAEYLDYENLKCRKRLVYILNEEYTDNVEEAKLAGIALSEDENKHKNKRSSCALYILFFSIIFTIKYGVGTYFTYYKYMNRDKKLLLDMIISIKKKIISINRKYQTN